MLNHTQKGAMIKKFTFLIVCVLLAKPSFAQTTSTATQTVHIQVAPAIEILTNTLIDILKKWKKNGGGFNWKEVQEGNDGNIADQEITVRSNKDFIVTVRTVENNPNRNVMLALVENNTGGKANPAFTKKGFAPVSATSQDLLSNCSFGNERSFAVNYQTNTTSKLKEKLPTKADIIYTATLP